MSSFALIAAFVLMLLTSKSLQNQPQAVEMLKSANELLDNASKLPLEKQNAKKMLELIKPNLFGIVCNLKIDSAKIGENLQKMHENFCGQFNEGKSIVKIAQNMKKTVANTEIVAINSEIFEKMPQKIQKLPFLNGKNKEMFSAFVGHLLVGNNFLTKIAGPIKNVIANKNNKCLAKIRDRRTKRGFDLESGNCGNSAGCNNNGADDNSANYNNGNNFDIIDRYCSTIEHCYFFFHLFLGLVCVGVIILCAIKLHQNAVFVVFLILASFFLAMALFGTAIYALVWDSFERNKFT